eukprot:TRINITY_DN4739_c0_g2_i1.p1 TRINITY_DN4739_c0_g2~~TRINITY_DN4739_c0_g2_i1.p1  ORF type:complete len:1780 (+),score=600.00 TRINITY_DN4739_c0_g2_i1:173-5512(+)
MSGGTPQPPDRDEDERETKDPLDEARKKGLLPDKHVRVLGCLVHDNPLRVACSRAVISPLFNSLVLALILSNCLVMGISFWRPKIQAFHDNAACPLDAVFNVLFAAEMVVKLGALGLLLHPRAYLRSTWNVLDGVIVVGGIIQISQGCSPGGGNMNILRSLRVLRPLRTMSRVKGMRIILRSLFAALPSLIDNIFLIGFLILIFAILGVQLFRGALHKRCYAVLPPDTGLPPNITLPLLIATVDTPCGGTVSCANQDIAPFRPEQLECADRPELYEHGPLTYDNTLLAVLLVFKLFTGDDWPDDMFGLQDAISPHVWIYFFFTFFVGNLFATNLFLAVLIDEYLSAKMRGEWEVGRNVLHERRGAGIVATVDEKLHVEFQNGVHKAYPLDTTKIQVLPGSMNPAAAAAAVVAADELTRISDRSPRSPKSPQLAAVHTTAHRTGNDSQADIAELARVLGGVAPVVPATEEAAAEPECETPQGVRGMVVRMLRHWFFDTAILAVTFLNVLCLAIDHHGINSDLNDALSGINLACTIIFIAEILLKVCALGPVRTFKDGFNVLDGVLVAISMPDLVQSSSSKFTAFRAAKALKIVGKWPSLHQLVKVIIGSLSDGSYISLLLLLEIFIFSILGMQLFEDKFAPEERRNYNTLWEAAYSCFVVITGDAWAGVMKEGMTSTGNLACFYFLVLFLVGNFVIMNVFIAVILGGLGDLDEDEEGQNGGDDDVPPQRTDETALENATKELSDAEQDLALSLVSGEHDFGFELQGTSANIVCSAVSPCGAAERAGLRVGTMITAVSGERLDAFGDRSHSVLLEKMKDGKRLVLTVRVAACPGAQADYEQLMSAPSTCESPPNADLGGAPSADFEVEKGSLRERGAWVIRSRAFDSFMFFALVLNCVFLALDSPRASSSLRRTLDVADLVFTVIFTIEMLLKMGVYGIWGKPADGSRPAGYLRDPWNQVDCVVVLTSLAGLAYSKLSVLRALRTLRLIVRVQSIRVLLSALIASMPAVSQGIVLCAFLFLLFAIFGVQVFKGQFYACNDVSVRTKQECVGMYNVSTPNVFGIGVQSQVNREWVREKLHFDHLWGSLQTLFAVAVGEGWSNIMYVGMDTTGVDKQPRRNSEPVAALFFVLFHIIGNFFALNLIIGILIDTFITKREEIVSAGLSGLTYNQRLRISEYRTAEKAMRRRVFSWRPQLPEGPVFRQIIFEIVNYRWFGITITSCIILNGVVFATVTYGQSEGMDLFQEVANYILTGVFIVEAVLKILGLGMMYFRFNWNRFDFLIVVFSIAALAVPQLRGVSAIRVLRLARLFRLVAKAKGLQKLFNVIFQLENILYFGSVGVLLAAIFFIFACVGVQLFGELQRPIAGIDHNMNFETVPNAMLTLFTISTTEAWLDVREGLMNTDDCDDAANTGKCGSPFAVLYVLAFMVIGAIILLNAFAAVVCELHGDQGEEEKYQKALDALAEFRDRWQTRFGTRQRVTCAEFIEGLQAVDEGDELTRASDAIWSDPKRPLIPRMLRESTEKEALAARGRARRALSISVFGRLSVSTQVKPVDGDVDEQHAPSDVSDCDSSDGEEDHTPQPDRNMYVSARPSTMEIIQFLQLVRIPIHHNASRDRKDVRREVRLRDAVYALSRKMLGATPRASGPPKAGLKVGDADLIRSMRLARPNTPHEPQPHEVTALHWFVVQRLGVAWRRMRQLKSASCGNLQLHVDSPAQGPVPSPSVGDGLNGAADGSDEKPAEQHTSEAVAVRSDGPGSPPSAAAPLLPREENGAAGQVPEEG